MSQVLPASSDSRAALPTIYLYLHTHWDREWYQPFEVYRHNLVQVVADVVDRLKSGRLPSFLLDGQASLLDDLLAIRADLAPEIAGLMKAGKLSAGPWYVLSDELLVGGESLIRNLKLGLAVTRQYGEPARVGYCPDTFGHSADLPRILKGFGIDTAFVWRGVPHLAAGPLFIWKSDDESRVTAYQLARGYYQTAFHANGEIDGKQGDAGAVAQADRSGTKVEIDVDRLCLYLSSWLKGEDDQRSPAFSESLNAVLVPVGGDHTAAPAHFDLKLEAVRKRLARPVSAGGSAQPGASPSPSKRSVVSEMTPAPVVQANLEVVSLAQFAEPLGALCESDELPIVAGELRDNQSARLFERAYVLQGVLSSRLYLKRQNRLCERRLARVVEPLDAFLSVLSVKPGAEHSLAHAWKLLLLNQPHDSICGCSVDSVHDEMEIRSKKLNELLDAVTQSAVEAVLAARGASWPAATADQIPLVDPALAPEHLLLFNFGSEPLAQPLPFRFCLEPGGESEPPPLLGTDPVIAGPAVTVQIDRQEVDSRIFIAAGCEPVVKRVEVLSGWLWAPCLAAMSVAQVPWPISARRLKEPIAQASPTECPEQALKVDRRSLTNHLLRVEVGEAGDLTVIELAPGGDENRRFAVGHTIKDVADCGDTYNFDPLPGDRALVARLTEVRPGLAGPLVASLLLTYELAIPRVLVAHSLAEESREIVPEKPGQFSRSPETIVHRLTTEVTLKRGVAIVFFETTWENHSLDHRLEVTFGTGRAVSKSFSESHFSIVERSHEALLPAAFPAPVEAGCEAPPDRFPAQRFFVANGQLFLNTGLPEYAVDGSAVSLTLLRAVSRLSRPRLTTRGGGAGPPVPTPQANCLGLNRVSYAFAPLKSDCDDAVATLSDAARVEAYALADVYEAPCFATLASAALDERDDHQKLELDGARGEALIECNNRALKVRATYFSAAGNALFVRLLNVTGSPQRVTFAAQRAVRRLFLVRLDESEIEELSCQRSGGRAPNEPLSWTFTAGAHELVTLKLVLARVSDAVRELLC